LRALDALALPLCCVTNKESGFALRVLEAADLARYFACVLCADLAEDRKPSPNLLLAACAKLGIEPDELLYVGDSRTDIIAARAAGCRIVAVTYGYQTHEALAALRPDGLIDDMRELMRLVRIPTVVEPHTIGRELAD
jgi:phosphoglycolate phosphatase